MWKTEEATAPYASLQQLTTIIPTSVAVGDLNEDGNVDIVVGGLNTLLSNELQIYLSDEHFLIRRDALTNTGVPIANPALRHHLAETLKKHPSNITEQDLASVRTFRIGEKWTEPIFEVPAQLEAISSLWIDSPFIREIRTENDASLQNLGSLTIERAAEGEFRIGKGFAQINQLSLRTSEVRQLNFEESMRRLFGVYAQGSHLEDFGFLVQTPRIDTLDLSRSDYTSLDISLQRVLNLVLSDTPLTELIIRDAPRLADLTLDRTRLTRLAGTLPRLERLSIKDSGLTEFQFELRAPQLITLNLEGNSVHRITLPEGVNHLNSLSLSDNDLPEIPYPAGLESVDWLWFLGNNAPTLTFPPSLKSIKNLFVSNDTVETLNVPEGATIGTVVGFDKNLITYYQPEIRWQAPKVRGDTGAAYFLSEINSGRGTFTIEFSDDLIHWTELDPLSTDGGSVLFSVSIDNSAPARFFRIVDGD